MFRLFFLCIFFVNILEASSTQTEDTINSVNIATINTLLIFTSQDGLNSGIYHFTNTPQEIDMTIYHLPFMYNFKSDTNFNFFVVGNVGYSRVELKGEIETISTTEPTLDFFNHIQTYTAGIGGRSSV